MCSKDVYREANLSRDHARFRAQVLRVAHVHLELDIRPRASDPEAFLGSVQIEFEVLEDRPEGVDLDFLGKALLGVEIDGVSLDPESAWDGTRIRLESRSLAAGVHRLVARFEGLYCKDGAGFHRFVDPADQETYVYTNLEPFAAHRVFPCFDQPDLKAEFSFGVLSPHSWEVISNDRAERVDWSPEGRHFHFPRGKRISTYLVNVTAGPYTYFEDPEARIPARLYVRPSLAGFVDPAELFEVTRRGFDFYEAYFECPYPFSKYDQVFAPEFRTGAMENVGAVLINDIRYLHPYTPSQEEVRERNMVLLHEMAHMWFGNLVTMQWWDGLWLNESFATYMSFVALEEGFEDPEAWTFFDRMLRSWAHHQDELSTTHPIETDVSETRGLFANFDGITYGKGCCVLKQLAHLLGPETFRKGVAHYLKEHSFSNTSNSDFFRSLAKVAGRDLEKWSKEWLHRSGINPLEVVRGEDRLTLLQEEGNGTGGRREQRLSVALGFETRAPEVLDLHLYGEHTEIELSREQLQEIRWVHPNYHTQGYGHIRLDSQTLQFLEGNLGALSDPWARTSFVDLMTRMLETGELSAGTFLRTAKTALEVAPEMLEGFSPGLHRCLRQVLVAPEFHAWIEPWREASQAALESVEDPDQAKLWYQVLRSASVALGEEETLWDWILGRVESPALDFNQDLRWATLVDLARLEAEGIGSALEKESLRDPSDRGQRARLEAKALRPLEAEKAHVFERMVEDQSLSMEEARVWFKAFFQPRQDSLTKAYVARYFELLPELEAKRGARFAIEFARGAAPAYLEGASVVRSFRQVLEGGGLSDGVRRAVKEGRDNLVRWQEMLERARKEARVEVGSP